MESNKDHHPLSYATPDLNRRKDAEEYFREPPDVGKIVAFIIITLATAVFLYLYFFRNWF